MSWEAFLWDAVAGRLRVVTVSDSLFSLELAFCSSYRDDNMLVNN